MQIETEKVKNNIVEYAQETYVRRHVEMLLGLNANSWKIMEEFRSLEYPNGVIPDKNATTQECIQAIFKYYQRKSQAKAEAAKAKTLEAESKRNYRSADTESGLPKIQEAAIIAKIKLDRAREESIHLNNLKDKGDIINAKEQYELLSIFLVNIANELKAISASKPETQEVVDRCFRHLHKFGSIICEQVNLDGDTYVTRKLEEEVDLDSVINSVLL